MCTDAQDNNPARRSIEWRIGLVGFAYPEWGGAFYPHGLADHRRLPYYAARHNAVEINTTFYGPPSPATVAYWARSVPADFRFAIKAPRDVTHGPTPEGALANAQGPERGHFERPGTLATMQQVIENAGALGERLGPILMQFPPGFDDRWRSELVGYLDRLMPALERARTAAPNARLALEFRHASWDGPAAGAMLAERGLILVHTDRAGRQEGTKQEGAVVGPLPPITATTDTMYVRFLGRHGQFRQRNREQFDPTARLERWKEHLGASLATSTKLRTVYVFFDNDFAGFAPLSAARFAGLVGASLPTRGAVAPPPEPSLFEQGPG